MSARTLSAAQKYDWLADATRAANYADLVVLDVIAAEIREVCCRVAARVDEVKAAVAAGLNPHLELAALSRALDRLEDPTNA